MILVALANLTVLALMIGAGFLLARSFDAFGYWGGIATCAAVACVAIGHGYWHKRKYGYWFGDQPPIIKVDDQLPGANIGDKSPAGPRDGASSSKP
jgi:hypothetical protein